MSRRQGPAAVVNTRRLFTGLLPALQIKAVCDVGSMNGADALIFRDAVPNSSVYAFEPNPQNLRLMQDNPIFAERNIRLVPLAASNFDGEAEFFVVGADYSVRDDRRGMSSLYRRSDGSELAAVVPIKTTRLDTFLADKVPADVRLALWIDTEGKAYEVIEGATGLAANIHLVHVEVETTNCIGSNQKLYPEVKALMQSLDFAELATDQPADNIQFNALFIRGDLAAGMRLQVRAWLARARLRRLAANTLRKLWPACAYRYRDRQIRLSSMVGKRH
jgi:FkbM family methyltransferase